MLAHQLLVPPVLGLADNGDFSRLWGHFGIRAQWLPPDERYFAYLVREWLVDPASATSTGFWSPDTLLLRLSLLVNRKRPAATVLTCGRPSEWRLPGDSLRQ